MPAEPAVHRPTPEGYRQALAARQTKPATDSKVRVTAKRRIRYQARQPEEDFGDGRQALAELHAKAAAQQRTPPRCDPSQGR
ncbi:hypothetical protein [Streptomyces nitrosporeus]|uniref:hypothetical protein n=1 Tax=Streptomyces nitrosporeus TaxID=28894 RepID=UPI00167C483A|nr:hypothetical protein [Streptomyces nitrosporeus]